MQHFQNNDRNNNLELYIQKYTWYFDPGNITNQLCDIFKVLVSILRI